MNQAIGGKTGARNYFETYPPFLVWPVLVYLREINSSENYYCLYLSRKEAPSIYPNTDQISHMGDLG